MSQVSFSTRQRSLCDLCSEFTPTDQSYQCSAAERSVQMKLYTLSKRHFVVVFMTFFLCLSMSVFVGFLGPPITSTSISNASDLRSKPKSMRDGPFFLESSPLTLFHQQLWLLCKFQASHTKDETKLEFPFRINFRLMGIDPSTGKSHVMYHGSHNRTRNLLCYKNSCSSLVLFHLNHLTFANYRIRIQFFGLNNITDDLLLIRDVSFIYKTFNPSFTQLEIWFRFIFLTLSFATICLYLHSLKNFFVGDWSIEQKWMAVLLPLLLLYNSKTPLSFWKIYRHLHVYHCFHLLSDPLLPLKFLLNSWLPSIIDSLFQATFLCALLLFWLCLYHSVRQNERRFLSFYLPKLIVVGAIWGSILALSSWQVYHELHDPTYYYKLDVSNFLTLKIIFFVLAGIYLLFLLYLLLRAYAELRSMPYFDIRLKFTTALMVIVIAVTVTICILRFGANFFDKNFVPEIATHYENSAEFLAFFGLLNFYMYTMAFVYSPSKNAILETHFKDDPGVSMINESDDEVLYESETNESSFMLRPGTKNGIK